ncbi:hypothetical protein PMI09_02464 [Rhizobium sp. CF122]|uniref:hypothetical protein n=1 Tax=Rhizobium sp. CF122 TaxID=1144312 RepID=UPI0002717DB8|nr:hypothetical protein [Rhizobium sp. CF122]EJL54373.1 hypothetical protein PMI09_02464 [Rhizobium sp. CF122]
MAATGLYIGGWYGVKRAEMYSIGQDRATANVLFKDAGDVLGAYANLQPVYAEEELPDNNEEVIAFLNPPPPPVMSVSARQFKLQLLAAGLLDKVDAWINTQSKAVQIAYEYSGTFVRTEPMMAAGFAAMGFTEEQINAFFTAAANL